MKHRLQGDKKTLASDGRSSGLTSEQPRRNPRLQGGVLPYLPAARHRAVVARILRNGSIFCYSILSGTPFYLLAVISDSVNENMLANEVRG